MQRANQGVPIGARIDWYRKEGLAPLERTRFSGNAAVPSLLCRDQICLLRIGFDKQDLQARHGDGW